MSLCLPLCAGLAVLGGVGGCDQKHDTFMMVDLRTVYKPADRILTVYGDMQPTLGDRCASDRDPNAPDGSGSPLLLVDTATPLSAFVTAAANPPLPFRHGEVALQAATTAGAAGPLRLLLCDVPLVRTDLDLSQFILQSGSASSGALGGVMGGDLLGRFALSLHFDSDQAYLNFTRSDIAPSCQLDDAVLPFRPLGGQLAVQVGDALVTYPATRITIAACVEPLADPLRLETPQKCLDPMAIPNALAVLKAKQKTYLTNKPPDQSSADRVQRWMDALNQITSGQCASIPDSIAKDLGDVIDDQSLLQPPYVASGADMQFLVSTAVPGLLISQTACEQRLGDPTRCTCADADKVELRLPGLNRSDAEAEYGCKIQLGSNAQTAIALVARQRYLSACYELARSRRQRYALPEVIPVASSEPPCLRSACLVNLQRDASQTALRCAYSGPDPQYACDDHASPVGAVVELGGPVDPTIGGGASGPDQIEALVVPDTARILQSANADIRSDGPQVDGVIGLEVLARLFTTIDYPQTRLAISCRCGDDPGHACRAYRGVTYNPADSCSQADALLIPPDHGRTFCR